jgi:hypothetical protein
MTEPIPLCPDHRLERLPVTQDSSVLAEFKPAFEVQGAGTATKVEILPQQP